MKKYLQLFFTFSKIGVMTFGGGYAMLPILQREVVEARGWATNDEMVDYYAIGQCTPGIIAVNTATFVGHKLYGIPGAVVATLGLVFPALIIITAIAAFLQGFADIPAVKNAFAGIRVCVCVLIINTVLKLRKTTLIDLPTAIIFGVVFSLAVFTNVSPAIFVILSGVAGMVIKSLGVGK